MTEIPDDFEHILSYCISKKYEPSILFFVAGWMQATKAQNRRLSKYADKVRLEGEIYHAYRIEKSS